MRTAILALLLTVATCVFSYTTSAGAEQSKLAPGVKGSFETMQAPVLRVYSAKDGESKFIAYVVRWKNTEVVVSDTLAASDFHPGEIINFSAMKIALPQGYNGRPTHALSFQIQPVYKAK